jgi:hypothetical protein
MSASSIAPAMPAISAKRDPIIFRWILLSCCGFLSILAIAAWWDPSIRWLHLFEALPYVAVIALAARTNRWAYALGVATAVFWTYSAAFVTNFFESGMRALNASIHDWAVSRADQIIAVPGVIFQLSLITACAGPCCVRRARRSPTLRECSPL